MLALLKSAISQEYQTELVKLDADRESLVTDGNALMRASSDVRASNIENKLSQLTTRWLQIQAAVAERWDIQIDDNWCKNYAWL